MFNDKKITIIGFSKAKDDPSKFYHCAIHQGARLLPYPGEEGMYQCPECGSPYNPSEVLSDTKITSRFAVNSSGKKIQSWKNKNKDYYDQQGNKLPIKTDLDLLTDLEAGHTIVSYHTTEDTTLTNKEGFTHVVRKK